MNSSHETIIREILIARGYDTPKKRQAFLSPQYELYRHDPYLLPDMDRAVTRLIRAHKQSEKVVIYGDYDIDGLTATTLLLDALTSFGISVDAFIPNRFVEGYGLSSEAIERIAKDGANLIVTVDCGSLSFDEIARANECGVDVIVTDHHSVGETIPDAVAVINPKRLVSSSIDYTENFQQSPADNSLRGASFARGVGPATEVAALSLGDRRTFSARASGVSTKIRNQTPDVYPFLDLAGVGVAFKLVQALQTKLAGLEPGQEKWLLDLVALGTVCDVVTLVDENRANVRWGIEVLRKTRRPGLRALMAVARVKPSQLDARSLGFGLGPRLNAAGRLETAQLSLDLLTTTDSSRALEIAEQLEAMNLERRAEQTRIFLSAVERASQVKDPVLIISDPFWSHGIIGIVAAKLLERYHKPTFVLQELGGGVSKGSARSFGDFSAVEGIRATEEHLIKGGGHKFAAGVTIKTEKISVWRTAMNRYYASLSLGDQLRYLLPNADVILDGFASFNEQLITEITRLEPYGHGNPSPIFKVSPVEVIGRRAMGEQGQHVKYTLADQQDKTFHVVAFNKSDEFAAITGDHVGVWVELTINEWQGRRTIEGRLLRMEIV